MEAGPGYAPNTSPANGATTSVRVSVEWSQTMLTRVVRGGIGGT